MTRERWMAIFFVAGSTCFVLGPFPGYANLVGDAADAVTFFVGSVLFTAGGALQAVIAFLRTQDVGVELQFGNYR